MKRGRRKFLKYLAFTGAIATMGISGCVSTPETTPTPRPTTVGPTPTSQTTTKKFTETKQCPKCSNQMYLQDKNGVLWWVCPESSYCGYTEKVTEEEILKKYGYM